MTNSGTCTYLGYVSTCYVYGQLSAREAIELVHVRMKWMPYQRLAPAHGNE
jgi:hypothetical protein